MDETLRIVLNAIVYVIIIGCVPILVKYLASALNAKIDELQASTKLSKYAQLNKYVDVAQTAITTAVTSVSQTYVDSLKKDGKFDEAAQTTAKANAIALAKSLITNDAKAAIIELFGDFETYLTNSIEEIVNKLK